MSYDPNNVFAKILRHEIPAKVIYEDAHVLAFYDAFPKTKQHAIIIPKGEYTSAYAFSQQASAEEQSAFWQAIHKVVDALGLANSGFRLLANHGADAHQEVPHFHMHVCGGQDLGGLFDESVTAP